MLDAELETMASGFSEAASEKLVGQNVAIGDLLDEDGQAIPLGKQLADELSFRLSDKSDAFSIIDRSHFKKLLAETNLGAKGLLNETTIPRLGRMAGISVIVYGNIYQRSNNYVIYLKYVHLESQTSRSLVKAYLTRIPSVDKLYNATETPEHTAITKEDSTHTISPANGLPQSFTSGPIRIDFQGCQVNQTVIDCTFHLISAGRSESLTLTRDNSWLQVGNRRLPPMRLFIQERQSGHQVTYPLRANQTHIAVLRFATTFLGNGAQLNLHGRAPSIYDFDFFLNRL